MGLMAPGLRRFFTESRAWHFLAAAVSPSDEARLRQALAEIREAFPFDNYLFDMAPHRFLAHLISSYLLPRQGRILDIGGGVCDKAAILAKMGFECEVWDDLEDPWHHEGSNFESIVAFAERMGVILRERKVGDRAMEQGTFDLVMINEVIEHLHESPRYMLNVAIHALREGGVLLVTTPNSVNLRKRLSVLLGRTNHPPALQFFESSGCWRGHVREWTVGEITSLLRWMGLVEVRTRTFHGLLAQRVSPAALRSFYRILTVPFPAIRDTICAWGKKPEGWTEVEAPRASESPFPLRTRQQVRDGACSGSTPRYNQEKIHG